MTRERSGLTSHMAANAAIWWFSSGCWITRVDTPNSSAKSSTCSPSTIECLILLLRLWDGAKNSAANARLRCCRSVVPLVMSACIAREVAFPWATGRTGTYGGAQPASNELHVVVLARADRGVAARQRRPRKCEYVLVLGTSHVLDASGQGVKVGVRRDGLLAPSGPSSVRGPHDEMLFRSLWACVLGFVATDGRPAPGHLRRVAPRRWTVFTTATTADATGTAASSARRASARRNSGGRSGTASCRGSGPGRWR